MIKMNITPAIDAVKQINMSAEEFQEKLCAWLQKRGLLCELRNYFRTNMITALSNTTLGSYISDVKHVTPKVHAVNLLIAEYLARAEYHYSLCVFCTEAYVVNVFPGTATDKFENVHHARDGGKFSQSETQDILETLGMSKDGDGIYSTYSNSPADSLLMCILNSKLRLADVDIQIETYSNFDDSYSLAIKHINKFLTNSKLSYEHQMHVKRYIKHMLDKQKEKSLLVEKSLRQRCRNEIAKYKQKMKDMEHSFILEKMQLDKEVFRLELILDFQKQEQNKNEKRNLINQGTEMPQLKIVAAENPLKLQTSNVNSELPKSALAIQDVENMQLKLLIKQLQMQNSNLRKQNMICMKRIQDVGGKVDTLLHELSSLNERTGSDIHQSVSQVDTCLQFGRTAYPCRNEADTQTANTVEQANQIDGVVQEARYKLRILELESNSIENFKSHTNEDGTNNT